MLEFFKGGCDVSGHEQVDSPVDVFSFECNSTIVFTGPIFDEAVGLFDAGAEMISVFLANILNSKIVHNKVAYDT